MIKIYKSCTILLVSVLGAFSVSAQMRITEYQYNGSEFVEFTNVGATNIDMTGWSYSDAARSPGDVSLSAYGIVNAGESVILSEEVATAFRTRWGLCAGVKVIGGNSTDNLGRSDEINLYDNTNTLVDRLTYNDASSVPPLGGPRTDTKSAWVPAAALGTNQSNLWVASTAADAEGSIASTPAAYFASPGKSTRATVVYNPCTLPPNGAPTIVLDTATTNNFIDGGDPSLSPLSPFATSGVISDPSDPASINGINFIIGDDVTAVNSLTVTAVSSNTTVVPNENIILSGTGSARNIKITPAAVGYANISVTVNDGTNNTTYIVNYAASAAASSPVNAVYHTGYSDASTAEALDENYMIVSDDEQNKLLVYNRHQSGLPVTTFDYSNLLALTDISGGVPREIDLEASARSLNNANRIYWMGSHSNKSNPSYDLRPNRNRFFATDVTGTGAATTFSFIGHYDGFRNDMTTWSNTNNLGLAASMADGFDPKGIDGLNIEGMAFAPDNTTMYIGFRAPLEPTTNRVNALIAPIQNFETWFGTGTTATPTLGAPILLDLGGRGIREITRLSQNSYIIAAGDYGGDATITSALYQWNGNASDAPVLLSGFNVSSFNPEGVLPIYSGGVMSTNSLEITNDDGTQDFYGDGSAAKDLAVNNFKKFSTNVLTTTGNPLPIIFQNFAAKYIGNGKAQLNWNMDNTQDYSGFDVERSSDGISFERVTNVAITNAQTAFQYLDNVCCVESYLYRIKALNKDGSAAYSAIQLVRLPGSAQLANISHAIHSNTVEINTPANAFTKTVNIFNLNGQRLITQDFDGNSKSISISGLEDGMYIVEVMQEGNATRKKIVK
jgi:hypothetical protein